MGVQNLASFLFAFGRRALASAIYFTLPSREELTGANATYLEQLTVKWNQNRMSGSGLVWPFIKPAFVLLFTM